MKNLSLDIQLIAAAPSHTAVDSHFTNSVMRRVRTLRPMVELVQDDLLVRKSLFARLQSIPKFVVILFAILALTLIGGSAYAVYKILWEQPSVTTTVESTNQFGRTQVVAQLENCGDQTSQVTFEAKIGNTLNSSEMSKILQARCEMEVIRQVIGESNGQSDAGEVPNLGTTQSSSVILYPAAANITAINATQLSLAGDKYTPTETLTLTDKTQFVIDGAVSPLNQMRQGDSVLFVQNITTNDTTSRNDNGEYTTEGVPTSREVLYVIKTSLPFEYYNQTKQSLIAQRQACVGNLKDSCIQTQQVDLYTNSLSKTVDERRSIQGIIIEHVGNIVKVQSSSGQVFTITTPNDIVNDFNTNKSALYDGIKISDGDLLQINYYSSNTILTVENIESVQLGLDVAPKDTGIKKY